MRDSLRTWASRALWQLPLLLLCLLPALLLAVCSPGVSAASFNYHDYDTLQLQLLSPPFLAGRNVTWTPAVYGNSIINPPGELGVTLELVLAWPDQTGCSGIDAGALARTQDGRSYEGLAVLVVRGGCSFAAKTAWAQAAGAALIVVYACSPAPPSLCKPSRDQMYSADPTATLASIMIDWVDGNRIAATLQQCGVERDAIATRGASALELLTSANSSVLSSGSSETLTSAAATVSFPADCVVTLFIPGTGPISSHDREALGQMGRDIVFDFINDRTGQSGALPSFATIRNASAEDGGLGAGWDPCLNRVAGIWCQGNPGRVVILDLDNMNLTGILSPAMGNLTALQQLILSSNSFWCTTLHPPFGQLTQLRVMKLFNMGLLAFQEDGDSYLDNLTELLAVDASNNALTELTSSMLHWKKLRALDVGTNNIQSEFGQADLGVFTQLEYLSMENNAVILDLDNVLFSNLSLIQTIRMSANRVRGSLCWEAFDDMPALVEVDFSINEIRGRLPGFKGTHNVQLIDFGGNVLEGNTTAWLMPSLTYLSLGGNNLSEPLESFPLRFGALQYMDVSSNRLSIDPAIYDDVGSFLFDILPASIQTVHLEDNFFAGEWSDGFLTTFSSLSHFYISNNMITSVPSDLFDIGGSDTIIDIDVSFNDLRGQLPLLPPTAELNTVRFDGNPLLRSPDGTLPSWVAIDPQGNMIQPRSTSGQDLYACPSLIGTVYHLSVTIDPIYYDFQGCECSRGTFGRPPHCELIPAFSLQRPRGNSSRPREGSFSDKEFGQSRFFQGVDTSFVLGLGAGGGENGARLEKERRNGLGYRVERSAAPAAAPSSVALASDAPLIINDPPLIVRAIYVTISLNFSWFHGASESLAVYAGSPDLRGERVSFWQGTDSSFKGNIDLQGMYPENTVTILGSSGVVEFRSSDAGGEHFLANYTLSADCPPGYVLSYAAPAPPVGACTLPSHSAPSGAVIILLVCSVVIGVLALCLLGQKMATIQNLIHSGSAQERGQRRGMNPREQAQEMYGPVLSVEEAWRRVLKRDLAKEAIMLGMEAAGYVANWIVVAQEMRRADVPVLQDSFLVAYACMTVLSTVTGSLSVYARTKGMRGVWRELKEGVAVVPTIASLLQQDSSRRQREQQQQQAHRSAAQQQQQQQQQHKSLNEQYGRPLLVPDAVDSSTADMDTDMSFMSHTRVAGGGGGANITSSPSSFSLRSGGPTSSPSMASMPSSSSGGGGGALLPGRGSRSGGNELAVRLSSKDPNVQLAAVSRTISTTRLTSWNLAFSTLPFLVLNQLRLFREGDLRADWVLQLSSLLGAMLLGVKLLRILALGELIQKRNQLVFEVISVGAKGVASGSGASSAGGHQHPHLSHAHHHHQRMHSSGSTLPHGVSGSNMVSRHGGGSFVSVAPSFLDREGSGLTSLHEEECPDSSSIFSPQSLRVPQGSLASTADGGQIGSHLLAPSASFGSLDDPERPEDEEEDEMSAWARKNAGSSMVQMKSMPFMATVAGAAGDSAEHAHAGDLSARTTTTTQLGAFTPRAQQ